MARSQLSPRSEIIICFNQCCCNDNTPSPIIMMDGIVRWTNWFTRFSLDNSRLLLFFFGINWKALREWGLIERNFNMCALEHRLVISYSPSALSCESFDFLPLASNILWLMRMSMKMDFVFNNNVKHLRKTNMSIMRMIQHLSI